MSATTRFRFDKGIAFIGYGDSMPYALFHSRFPELAERETRSITVLGDSVRGLPTGEYGFLEMYCDERSCDCRRVFFSVLSRAKGEPIAVIAYGWERPEFYARWLGDDDPLAIKQLCGPVLNFGSPQSDLAPAILELVRNTLLRDTAYVERLKTHYRMFRGTIDKEQAPTVQRKKKRKRKPRARKKRKG